MGIFPKRPKASASAPAAVPPDRVLEHYQSYAQKGQRAPAAVASLAGKLYEDMGQTELALKLYEEALLRLLETEAWSDAEMLLATALKANKGVRTGALLCVELEIALGRSQTGGAVKALQVLAQALKPSEGSLIERTLDILDRSTTAPPAVEVAASEMLCALGRPERAVERLQVALARARAGGDSVRAREIEDRLGQLDPVGGSVSSPSRPNSQPGPRPVAASQPSAYGPSPAANPPAPVTPAPAPLPLPVPSGPPAPLPVPGVAAPFVPLAAPAVGEPMTSQPAAGRASPPLPPPPPPAIGPFVAPGAPLASGQVPAVPASARPQLPFNGVPESGRPAVPMPPPLPGLPGTAVPQTETPQPVPGLPTSGPASAAPLRMPPTVSASGGEVRVRTRDETDIHSVDDVAALAHRFASAIGEVIGADDAEAHLDLGWAFLEMQILEEAVNEFRLAFGSPVHRLRAAQGLAQALVENGDAQGALEAIEGVLATADTDVDLSGMVYWRARALEALGRVDGAKRLYEQILAGGRAVQDASDRLRRLTI